jgi:hypothetical protein
MAIGPGSKENSRFHNLSAPTQRAFGNPLDIPGWTVCMPDKLRLGAQGRRDAIALDLPMPVVPAAGMAALPTALVRRNSTVTMYL